MKQAISVLETNIDDVRGEILGGVFDQILSVGALDVSLIPVITKKNRPGHILKVICMEKDEDKLIEHIIRSTGTLGVRIEHHMRYYLEREIVERKIELMGKEFLIHVKQARDEHAKIVSQKIEFEDLKSIAQELDITPLELERQIHLLK